MSRSTLNVAARTSFFGELVLAQLGRDEELTQSAVARSIFGIPEESLRNYMFDPSKGLGINVIHRQRKRMPLAMLVDLLRGLAGERAVVLPATEIDLPENLSAGDVLTQTIGALRHMQDLIEQAHRRCTDGVICAEDATVLTVQAAAVKSSLDRAVAMSQAMAARRR